MENGFTVHMPRGLASIDISFGKIGGIETDLEGNVIDQMEPSTSDILNLMAGPKLTHKGEWLTWFQGFCDSCRSLFF